MDASQRNAFLSLPPELRRLVYAFYFAEDSGKVEVFSNYFDGQPPGNIRFYTIKDLALLETNEILRTEAIELFYAENLFVLNLYGRRREEYGEQPHYGRRAFRVDLRRIRRAHIVTPSGHHPKAYDDCIRGAGRMRASLEGLKEALSSEHSMRYLLIESYDFEKAVMGEDLSLACDLKRMLRPLETVRGLTLCHIRSLQVNTWPYLEYLERTITGDRVSDPQSGDLKRRLADETSVYKAGLTCGSDVEDRPEIDRRSTYRIFELFGLEPLYRDTAFLNDFRDDM